jgi:ubiquinone/menaquinone biosynthesis C-methylase UbiE
MALLCYNIVMFSDPAVNIAKLGMIEGMKVVDLGAGSGFYSIEAGRRVGSSGRVYAVEVQRDLLDKLRSTASSQGVRNVEVVWGDIEKVGGTKLRDSIADRVILSNVLFQVQKPDDLALEVKRITKPGGKLMVIDWSDVSPLGPKTPFSMMKAEALFNKVGFEVEQSFGAGDHHYGLILIKK